jgi:Putative MetA-pathway of phenol degradation
MFRKSLQAYIIAFLGMNCIVAQSLNDGIFMHKNITCVGVAATHDSWDQYYEGSLLRKNGNIGTVTTQSVGVMGNYGIRNDLNVIAMLPYVRTRATGGTLAGMSGLQDLTVGLKYKLIEKPLKNAQLSVNVVGVASTPITNYVADHMPLAIGMRCKTASARLMLHYITTDGWTGSITGGYTARGSIQLDRNSYYTTQLVENNQVKTPNMTNISARLGYCTFRLAAELLYETNKCTSGSDIRRQDMPFLTNKNNASRAGFFVYYRIKALKDIQLMGQVQRTIAGRNTSKSNTYTCGVFHFFGKKEKGITTAPSGI